MSENLLLDDPVLLKRLAKLIVQQCFRNTVLEDYHAGIVPASKTGDYSDVVVKSPYGEVNWRDLSRISDDEMKVLMKQAVTKTYQLLRADSEGWRSAFRTDVDHDSEVMPISVPN